MMKMKYFALSAALVMVLALTGCSANRADHSTAPDTPSNSVQNSDRVDNDDRNSASVNNDYNSPGAGTGNDAMQGGGAGGTNDLDNDGFPDGSAGITGNDSVNNDTAGSGAGQVADDIGRAAGDLARGVGNVARGTGDAIGNAANNVGNAMR